MLTAAAATLMSSVASADFTTRLSEGRRFSVSASQCQLSILKERTSQVLIKCSLTGVALRRSTNIELKRGQKALLESKSCKLKVTTRSPSLIRVACAGIRRTPSTQTTPSPIVMLPFTANGMFEGRCYLDGKDTGEVESGTGYCSADGLTYVDRAPANGLVSGLLYQRGLAYSGIYQGGLYSNGAILTSSGSLDKETFQGTGFVSSNVGISADTPYTSPSKVLVQADSKIVVVGHAFNDDGGVKPVIIRYVSDGTLDPSFGTGGAVILPYGDPITSVFQFGEKILLGTTNHIVRLNSDGSSDITFGQGGQVDLSSVGYLAYERYMAFYADGRIVVAGRALNPGVPIVVGRFNTDGSIDTSFGTTGLVTINDSPDMYGVRIATQQDGGIIISRSGDISGPVVSQDQLYRLNSNGSIDTSFGDQGKAGLPNTSGIAQIATQSNGGILVVTGSQGKSIYRVKPTGGLDTDFGISGVAVLPGLPSERSSGFGIGTLQTDGKILLNGYSEAVTNQGSIKSVGLIVRLTATGGLDNSFGTNGIKEYNFVSTGYNGVASLSVQNDGRIVGAAGAMDVDGRFKIFTFRLWS